MGGIRGLPWLVLSVRSESAQVVSVVAALSILSAQQTSCAKRVTDVTDLSLAGIERHRARPTNQHLCVTCVTVRVCAKDS